MPKYLYVHDALNWQQFGAPDPVFFDRYIKDTALFVLSHVGDYYTIQDPTDPEGVFSVSAEWVAQPKAKTRRIPTAHAKQRTA